ncbi:MAG: hypothetical protein LAT84_06325 [Balneolia bacterium]|nr:hypothetical protein [Balneolia bacterium]
MEVASSQIDIVNIEMVSDEAVCNLIGSHIMDSGEFHSSVQDKEKVYLKHETSQRYFIVFYTSPAQPGFSTGVYVLDYDLNKLGKFGV